jgi:hypothetical protein
MSVAFSGKPTAEHKKDRQEDSPSHNWLQRCSDTASHPWDHRVCADLHDLKCSHDHFMAQFFCNVDWSLQYLSVADSTVLTFLAPLTTALAGRIFLQRATPSNQFSREVRVIF